MNLLIVIETKVLIKKRNKSVSIWLVTRLSYFEFFILGYFSHVLRYFFLLFPEIPGMFWYVLPLVLDSIQDSYDLYAKNRSLLMTTKAKKKKKKIQTIAEIM